MDAISDGGAVRTRQTAALPSASAADLDGDGHAAVSIDPIDFSSGHERGYGDSGLEQRRPIYGHAFLRIAIR
jgi:hypothetical protein